MLLELDDVHKDALVEAINVYLMVKTNNLTELAQHLGDGNAASHASYYLLQALGCLVVPGTPGTRMSIIEHNETARVAYDLRNTLLANERARLSQSPPPSISDTPQRYPALQAEAPAQATAGN